MRLSTRGRYAVMAMVDLAQHAGERPVALSDIAVRQGISLSYLEQLFSKLRKEELVRSIRGPGGGYHLAKDAKDISISSVILAVDEPLSALGCDREGKGTDGCTHEHRCITHRLWGQLTRNIHLWLDNVSLEDVCSGVLNNDEEDLLENINPMNPIYEIEL
ncbi:MAG: Rrf2 family transcriptional regulator [Alphaproteobacteria bacterium]